MPRLPRVSGQEAIRSLERIGFVQVRQCGSHVVLRRSTPQGDVGCVVPLHRELALGTLAGILKQAKVTVQEFTDALRSLCRSPRERIIVRIGAVHYNKLAEIERLGYALRRLA